MTATNPKNGLRFDGTACPKCNEPNALNPWPEGLTSFTFDQALSYSHVCYSCDAVFVLENDNLRFSHHWRS